MAEAEGTAGFPSTEQERSSRRKNRNERDDVSRLSRSGNSLYELLDIPKSSTNEEIKKKYRRLALKYHPDKNPDNVEAEEMFKKINHANSILRSVKAIANSIEPGSVIIGKNILYWHHIKHFPLKPNHIFLEKQFMFRPSYCIFSDEKKRPLYDEYGSFGLYIAEQVGEEFVGSVMFFQSGWFKVSQSQPPTSEAEAARLIPYCL